jgi:dihydroorotate dehydrogenase
MESASVHLRGTVLLLNAGPSERALRDAARDARFLIESCAVVNEKSHRFTPLPGGVVASRHLGVIRSATVTDSYGLLLPLMRLLPAEVAHDLAMRAMVYDLAPVPRREPDPRLACRFAGKALPSPLGIAAGFDKDAEAVDGLLRLGFAFVEVGTVTPRPQPGNPRPRLFRLKRDRALVNRMGFNNHGLTSLTARLGRFRAGPLGERLVGVNVGKNKDSTDAAADYAAGVRACAPYADFIVCNVSSPNTPGLRALQGRAALAELVAAVKTALAETGRALPLLVKIAPDLTPQDREDIAQVALEGGLDGLVVSNTTITRPATLRSPERGETGGLSGPPLFAASTELLRDMARLTQGRLTLFGVGGVSSGADAYAKIRAGASLVQVYTAFVYQGPGLIVRVERELSALLAKDGFATVSEAVGADLR